MKSQDIDKIKQWGEALEKPVSLTLITTDAPQSEAMERFCDAFAGLVSGVVLERVKDAAADLLPAIRARNNLRFHMVPAENELPPFLNALAPAEEREETANAPESGYPAGFRLYTTAQCPFCPLAITQMARLAREHPAIRVSVIDAALFPDMAVADGVHSVPLLILDGRFRWAGRFSLSEVERVMTDRNPADLSAASLESLIREGRAGEVAQLMIAHDALIPGFLDLLISPEWPTRLGAMVASEIIAGEAPDLAAELADTLWRRYDQAEESVKGDILYVIGCCGMEDLVSVLEEIRETDQAAELRQAAEEAVESIRDRTTAGPDPSGEA